MTISVQFPPNFFPPSHSVSAPFPSLLAPLSFSLFASMNLDAKYWEGTCLSTVHLLNYFPRVRGEILKPLTVMMAPLRTVMTQYVIPSLIHISFRRTFQRRICISSLSPLIHSHLIVPSPSDAILPHSIHSTQWEKNFINCIFISITRFKTTRWYLRWGIRSQGMTSFSHLIFDLFLIRLKDDVDQCQLYSLKLFIVSHPQPQQWRGFVSFPLISSLISLSSVGRLSPLLNQLLFEMSPPNHIMAQPKGELPKGSSLLHPLVRMDEEGKGTIN